MYKIIGVDSRQYGPVSAETLREWIRTGRANQYTMTKAEGSDEWKPLSSFPEFAADLAARTPPLPPPPAGSAERVEALAYADEVVRRDYRVEIGASLSRAWDLLLSDFWPIVGISALVTIILVAVNSAYLGILLNGPVMGGLVYYMLKRIRGQRGEIADAFAGFTLAFVQLLLASLVTVVLEGVGLVLCILPGIYLAVAWCLTFPLIVDKGLAFWDAMEVSRRIVTRHWWTFLWALILFSLINLLGTLLCCVGGFVTGPLTTLALIFIYEDIFGPGPLQRTAVSNALAPLTPAGSPTAAAPTLEPPLPATSPGGPPGSGSLSTSPSNLPGDAPMTSDAPPLAPSAAPTGETNPESLTTAPYLPSSPESAPPAPPVEPSSPPVSPAPEEPEKPPRPDAPPA